MAAPIDNIPGEMILFPSYIVHWTDQNTSKTPRISIAFDIITEEVYNMIDNHNFRVLNPG
jgi:ectoine hydroxylase-related dioxygenase (phytanoyl-CoA dioxygenase family)